MNYNEAIDILAKMKSKFVNEKPNWYATATEEERTAFEQKNSNKIAALDIALRCIKGHKQLQRAAAYIEEFIGRTYEGDNDE